METAYLASPTSNPTADARLRHSLDVAVLLSPSARERLRPYGRVLLLHVSLEEPGERLEDF
jgi:hypothetical protein